MPSAVAGVAVLVLLCATIVSGRTLTNTPSLTRTFTAAVSESETTSSSASYSVEDTWSKSTTRTLGTVSFSKERSVTPTRSPDGSISGKTPSYSQATSSSDSASPSQSDSASTSVSATPSTTVSKATPTSNQSSSTTSSLLPPTVSTSPVETASTSVTVTTEETRTLSTTRSLNSRSPPTASWTSTDTVTSSKSKSVRGAGELVPSLSASVPTPTASNVASSTRTQSRTSSQSPSDSDWDSSTRSPSPSASTSPTSEATASPWSTTSTATSSSSISRSASATASFTKEATASFTPSVSEELTGSMRSLSASVTISEAMVTGTETFSMTLTRPLPPSKTPSPSQQTSISESVSESEVPSKSTSSSSSRSPTATKTLWISSSLSSSVSAQPTLSTSVTVGSDTSSYSSASSATRSWSPTPARSTSKSVSSEGASTTHTQSTSESSETSRTTSVSGMRTPTDTISTDLTGGSWSPSLSAQVSISSTRATSRRGRATVSLTGASLTADPSQSESPSLSLSRSPTSTDTLSKGSFSPSDSFESTPSTSDTPTLTYTESQSASRSATIASVSPTASHNKISVTRRVTPTQVTLSTSFTLSSFASSSASIVLGSITNNNKSFTKTRSDVTITQLITITDTKRRTLTLTQTIVQDIRVSNALGSYLLSAFDFTAVDAQGPCSASASLLTLILIAFCVVGIAVVVYRRLIRRERPDITAAGEVAPVWVVLRENIYTGTFFPCHYHCWWIHSVSCLVHINLVFLITACILYAFEKQSGGGGGLLSGTSAIGVVAGIIGAALAHVVRPIVDIGFYYVTFFQGDKRRCQNDDGMTWDTWHRLAEERRLVAQREQLALQRRLDDDRKSGLHMLRTALTTDVDANAGGWGDAPSSRPLSPHDVDLQVPAKLLGDIAAQRAVTHDVDLCIGGDDGDDARWEPQAHDEAASMQARHRKLQAKWANPLSQSWWGPVETHHLLVGVTLTLCVMAMLIGFQNLIHRFDPSACRDRTSPLAVALLISFFFDVFLFEPLHQCFRLVWRYALEHEGNVDYTTTFLRRVTKLITLESSPHPYFGAMLLWPEDALAEGTSYVLEYDDTMTAAASVVDVGGRDNEGVDSEDAGAADDFMQQHESSNDEGAASNGQHFGNKLPVESS